MAETHRACMARVHRPVRPVFLDTLAGFESNIDGIDRKAHDYFQRNFGLDLAVARYRTGREGPQAVTAAIGAITQANYILAGPGSPSYGIRVLGESPIWQAVLARWREGAVVVFASAAAIIVGARSLPVYEIYKAGQDPGWMHGLDLLGEIGLRAAVVPHWNTASGEGYDTRFCYMGSARFEVLERQLEPGIRVLGIDEYTGLCIDPGLGAGVLGSGRVTIREAGRQAAYARGERIAFDDQAPAGTPMALGGLPSPAQPGPGREASGDADILALRARVGEAIEQDQIGPAVDGLVTLSLIAGAGLEQALPGRAELAVQTLQVMRPKLARLAQALQTMEALQDEQRALVDLLVTARSTLRDTQEWAAADRLRDRLAALGYVLADSPAGTTWSRAQTAQ
jgi:hypothetical protein